MFPTISSKNSNLELSGKSGKLYKVISLGVIDSYRLSKDVCVIYSL